jgi:hypothetical protein
MKPIEWGPEIACAGAKPAWLENEARVLWAAGPTRFKYQAMAGDLCWGAGRLSPRAGGVDAFKIPAEHWAYPAIDGGFVPWPGGEKAPEDWDGAEILFRDGGRANASKGGEPFWFHGFGRKDVVGYRKRVEAEPAPVQWGPEIEVNGVQPAWLRKTDIVDVRTNHGWCYSKSTEPHPNPPEGWSWAQCDGKPCIVAIRLRPDHFAYLAIREGFEPWAGGETAPEHWDGNEVLLACGRRGVGVDWRRASAAMFGYECDNDIIGYRKRAEPVPADADTVTLKRFSELDRARLYPHLHAETLRNLGLIREETPAERFTRETGHEITAAVEAALAWERAA